MIVGIIVLTLIFFFAAFFRSASFTISNAFISFLFFQAQFVIDYFIFFFLGFVLCLIYLLRKKNTLFHSFFHTLALLVTSLFFSFVMLIAVAWVQTNIYALLLNSNPAYLGVTTNMHTIIELLKNLQTPPVVVVSQPSPQSETSTMVSATVGTNFYGSTIVSSIPSFLIFPAQHLSQSFLLLDNTLIITRTMTKDLQTISPTLGYVLVQAYFPNRHIKTFPSLSVMTPNQFLNYQKTSRQEKSITIKLDIQKMEEGISSFSAAITNDANAISQNQSLTTTSLKKQNSEYDACLSSDHYEGQKFIPDHTKAYCQSILTTWDTTISSQQNENSTLTAKLRKDQEQLEVYKYYDKFFKAQQSLMTLANNFAPDELGEFSPPYRIYLVLSPTTFDVTTYLETLCHEYLHYASYVPGKRFDSSFFEEGFTEYFARQVINDAMHIQTNIAYPGQVAIIKALTKRIAEPDLAQLYFSKDELGLEKELDLAYGDTFYKDNYIFFESMQYTTDPKQITQLTNTILKHMGEKPLSEKDIYQ